MSSILKQLITLAQSNWKEACCGKEEQITVPSHGKQQGNDLTHVSDSRKDTLQQSCLCSLSGKLRVVSYYVNLVHKVPSPIGAYCKEDKISEPFLDPLWQTACFPPSTSWTILQKHKFLWDEVGEKWALLHHDICKL